MDYKHAVAYLDSFINYEKIGYRKKNILKLEKMRLLAILSGDPQKYFRSVHIAGTKGKGSVARFIFSILREAGFNTGLYISPHLVSPRERIRFNDDIITESDFALQIDRIKKSLERASLPEPPTFFEIYTICAFNYFKERKADYAVVEVGLGGRLDATNILKPSTVVISPISYDHTHILGNTLGSIAFEKSGIIKEGCVCVSAPQAEEALEVIKKKCASSKAKLVLIGKDVSFTEKYHDDKKEIFDVNTDFACYKDCMSYLLGRHQLINAACAISAVENLDIGDTKIKVDQIKKGIEKCVNPGRCEVVSRNPYLVFDGAQNRASAEALKNTILRNFHYEDLVLVLGVSRDKDIQGICRELAPLADKIVLTKSKVERAEDPEFIRQFIDHDKVIVEKSLKSALKIAESSTRPQDMILVTGSFFVIGEAKELKNETAGITI